MLFLLCVPVSMMLIYAFPSIIFYMPEQKYDR